MKLFVLFSFIFIDLLMVYRNYKNSKIYGKFFKNIVHIPYIISVPIRNAILAISIGIIDTSYNVSGKIASSIWIFTATFFAIITIIVDHFHSRNKL